MADLYEKWLSDVQAALQSMNMPFNDWQKLWPFDFRQEFKAGAKADDDAAKANHFWWHQQNKSLKQDCRKTANCWLPHGHQGECQPVSSGVTQPTYAPGDYVKAEFPDKATGIAEWMWVRVSRCDLAITDQETRRKETAN